MAPTAAEQVAFLRKIQRLLSEGGFVASYKYALLLALADLSVEVGDDSGDPLRLDLDQIAEKFIGYYWRQAVVYPSALGSSAILKQNTGGQAKIVQLVQEARKNSGATLVEAKANRTHWKTLVREVRGVVKTMPLWKLQTVGQEELDFLYPKQLVDGGIELRPGIVFCFRLFHGFVEDLVHGAWVRFVRSVKDNRNLFGDISDLDEFLFGSERAGLLVYKPILADLQKGLCFYCNDSLKNDQAVDHFVPWSRYPVDLGHNFVLAHGTKCNGQKSNLLPAYEHLERWCERNDSERVVLEEAFREAKIAADAQSSMKITRWAYEQTQAASGLVWVKGKELVRLDDRWRSLTGMAV